MPNRIIKESICTSDEIDSLLPSEEVFFYRLLVNCDDYGCMDARPRILIARLFPLKEISEDFVISTLSKLNTLNLVGLYEVNGRPYLHMTSWEEHQQIRAHKHKYPFIEDDNANMISADSIGYHLKSYDISSENKWCDINGYQMISDDINRNQTQPDEIKCVPNPIQSESNPNPNPIASSDNDVIHALDFLDSFDEENKVNNKAKKRISSKKQNPIDDTPIVFQLMLNDGSCYDVHQSEINELISLYPNVNVEQEFRNMIGWIKGNPTKRKTKSGINRFINSWLAREQNKYHVPTTQLKAQEINQKFGTDTSALDEWGGSL